MVRAHDGDYMDDEEEPMGLKVIVYEGGALQVCEIERLTPTGIVRWVEGKAPGTGIRFSSWRPQYRVPYANIWPYSEENLTRLEIRQERLKAAGKALEEAKDRYREEVRLAEAACGVPKVSRDSFGS